MSTHQHTRPLRLLILVAIGAVLVFTLQSFLKRWRGQLPGQGGETAANVKPLAGEVDQQTRAFSLSKTEGDHTLYTIKAEQVTTFKDTQKNLLHGVVVDIFGRATTGDAKGAGKRHDRITTSEAEYDPAMQTLWVPGEVEMDFGLPATGAGAATGPTTGVEDKPAAAEGTSPRVVINTSQLHFDQSSGVATTDAPVRFTLPRGEGSSRGARYDPQAETLQLVSNVEFRLREEGAPSAAPSKAPAPPVVIRAGEMLYLRGESRIALNGTVEITKQSRRLRARSGSVWLDDANQVQRAELLGDVLAEQRRLAGVQDTAAQARAGRALLDFGAGGAIRTVEMLDGVKWESSGGNVSSGGEEQPEREGSSSRMLLTFAPVAGKGSVLDRATATNNVKITLRSSRGGTAPGRGANTPTAGQMQVLTGAEAEMRFAQAGRVLRDANLRGAAAPAGTAEPKIEMFAEPGAPPRTVTAGSFDFDFSDGGELTQFTANENVRVVSPVPATATTKADTRITTSKDLVASFDAGTGKLATLRQSGNFTYQDAARRAQAASALYQADSELLTLERGPRNAPRAPAPQPAITQPAGRITADVIKLFTRSGDLDAAGAVATTFTSTSSASSSGAGAAARSTPREPVHAVADKLSYDGETQAALYTGRTRLWQGTGFLLESEQASLDRRQSLLTATGKVLTIFRPTSTAPAAGASSKSATAQAGNEAGTYTVRSDKVSYAQPAGKIVYEGNVRATQDRGTLIAGALEIQLRPAGKNASAELDTTASRIEKMTGRGGVQLSETGRTGTGDTVEYFADKKRVNLYGKPATLIDPARGSTKGVQLSYQIGDNSASVVGDGGEQTETRWIPAK